MRPPAGVPFGRLGFRRRMFSPQFRALESAHDRQEIVFKHEHIWRGRLTGVVFARALSSMKR